MVLAKYDSKKTTTISTQFVEWVISKVGNETVLIGVY